MISLGLLKAGLEGFPGAPAKLLLQLPVSLLVVRMRGGAMPAGAAEAGPRGRA